MDITQNAKLFLESNDPSFLLRNSDFVNIYNQAYNILSTLQDQTNQENKLIIYAIMASCSLIGVILIVVYWGMRGSIEASRHVLKIIMNSKDVIV